MGARVSRDVRPALGRWCHPTSDRYAGACDSLRKAQLANVDNDIHNWKEDARPVREMQRDPVSVFAYGD